MKEKKTLFKSSNLQDRFLKTRTALNFYRLGTHTKIKFAILFLKLIVFVWGGIFCLKYIFKGIKAFKQNVLDALIIINN